MHSDVSEAMMMDKPTCSVVVTCYNYARYLPVCLDSVLKQTYQDFEIIVVNDGSTDNTDEVVAPYLADPRIRYIKQANVGQANAKNMGIKNAKGEFIAFLDADDLWDETKLEKQLPLFRDLRVGVVYSKAKYINEQGMELRFQISGKYLKPRSGNVNRYLVFDNFVPFSSSIIRQICIAHVGSFNESIQMGIDWDLWLRVSAIYQFQYVDKPLLLYRLGHPEQMSKKLEVRQRCSEIIMSKFSDSYPDLVSHCLRRRIWNYSYINRGNYYREIDLITSSKFFLRAFCQWPFSIDAVKSLIKNMFLWKLRKS